LSADAHLANPIAEPLQGQPRFAAQSTLRTPCQTAKLQICWVAGLLARSIFGHSYAFIAYGEQKAINRGAKLATRAQRTPP